MTEESTGRVNGPDTVLGRLRHAPMMDDALGTMYAPLEPLVKRIHLHRRRARRHRPQDVLVPEGFTVDVVAIGFHAPVHCCFDDQGFCYVIECGHKIEAKPRILKVHVTTGQYEVFFSCRPSAGRHRSGHRCVLARRTPVPDEHRHALAHHAGRAA
jgi:hypothetical protein